MREVVVLDEVRYQYLKTTLQGLNPNFKILKLKLKIHNSSYLNYGS